MSSLSSSSRVLGALVGVRQCEHPERASLDMQHAVVELIMVYVTLVNVVDADFLEDATNREYVWLLWCSFW